MTQYYGKLHQTGAYANIHPWELTSEYILMDGPPPAPDATAQADGTWAINGEVVCDCLLRKIELKKLRKSKQECTSLTITLPVGVAGAQSQVSVEFNPTVCNFRSIHDKAGVTSYNGFDGFDWKCDDGTFRYFTAVVMRELSKKLHHYEQACFDREKALILELEATTDPNTIDITSGWPSTELTITI